MIDIKLLLEFGAVHSKLPKGSMLFREGDTAVFYYQVVAGEVKMNNYDERGNETIQGIFREGQSFAEPAILGDFVFPANAEAISDTQLIKLEKSRFFDLLKRHPEISLVLLRTLSKRLRFKAILSKEVKSYDAEHRIMTLLKMLKENNTDGQEGPVDITRQTIANLTGLRVETVIRSIKKLAEQKKLQIIKGKVYL